MFHLPRQLTLLLCSPLASEVSRQTILLIRSAPAKNPLNLSMEASSLLQCQIRQMPLSRHWCPLTKAPPRPRQAGRPLQKLQAIHLHLSHTPLRHLRTRPLLQLLGLVLRRSHPALLRHNQNWCRRSPRCHLLVIWWLERPRLLHRANLLKLHLIK